jgi:hypothetical protein
VPIADHCHPPPADVDRAAGTDAHTETWSAAGSNDAGIRTLPLGPLGTRTLPSGLLGTWTLPLGLLGTRTLPLGPVCTGSVPLGLLGTRTLPLGPLGTGTLPLGLLGTRTLPLGPLGTGTLSFGPLGARAWTFSLSLRLGRNVSYRAGHGVSKGERHKTFSRSSEKGAESHGGRSR